MPRRRPLLLACPALALAALAGPRTAGAQAVGPEAAAAAGAAAPPQEIAAALADARLRGRAVLRFLGLAVYDAQLWTTAPPAADPLVHPSALALTYARSLVGALIARRSIEEMRGIGPFGDDQAARWLQAMTALFPDVRAGDRLTGLHLPGRTARFFFNGQPRGEVADAEFARLFFGIWLSPRSSEPRLRAQLLGSAP